MSAPPTIVTLTGDPIVEVVLVEIVAETTGVPIRELHVGMPNGISVEAHGVRGRYVLEP